MAVDPDQLQGFANDRMLDFVRPGYRFHLGIFQDDSFGEALVQRDVNVFIDGGGNYKSRVLAVIRRQVSAAAAERNAQRTAGNNHNVLRLTSVILSGIRSRGQLLWARMPIGLRRQS